MLKTYLHNNLWKSFWVSPLHVPRKAWVLVPFFAVTALIIGFSAEIFHFQRLASGNVLSLLFTLFLIPSLFEETFFRGILIPRETLQSGHKKVAQTIGWSTLTFVVWHPINAWLFNPVALPLFSSLPFLLIVTALGITCGYSYIVSKSIWVPTIIHWVTVTVWFLFLGGKSLILAS